MSTTPDWKLKCFEWLKLDQWTPKNLLTLHQVEGKKYCKVCDAWVVPKDEKSHCAHHRREEKARKKVLAAQAAKNREQALTFNRKENQMARTAVNRPAVYNTLSASDTGLTVAGLSEASGVGLNEVRKALRTLVDEGKATVVDHVKTGKRGRPAPVYKLTGTTGTTEAPAEAPAEETAQ